jgi:hypothetical protein
MSLPFLPGNVPPKTLGKTDYHKSHNFDVKNENGLWVGETKLSIQIIASF